MHSVMPVKYVEKLRKAFVIIMMLAQIWRVNVEIASLHKFFWDISSFCILYVRLAP